MRLAPKNRLALLVAIAGIVAAAVPEPDWARVALAVIGIVAVWLALRATQHEDTSAAVQRAVEVDENLDAHATTHDYLRTVTGRLFRDQDEILRSGSLVDRLRLASAQLALFSREQQLSNPPPPMTTTLEGTELKLTEASRIAAQRWTAQQEQAARTFRNAFGPRIRDLLGEAAARPHVGQLVRDAVARIETVADPIAMYGLAANVNEIAMVIENGKPIR